MINSLCCCRLDNKWYYYYLKMKNWNVQGEWNQSRGNKRGLQRTTYNLIIKTRAGMSFLVVLFFTRRTQRVVPVQKSQDRSLPSWPSSVHPSLFPFSFLGPIIIFIKSICPLHYYSLFSFASSLKYFPIFSCFILLLLCLKEMFSTPHFVTGDYKPPGRFLPTDEYGRALDCLVKGEDVFFIFSQLVHLFFIIKHS